MVFALLRRKSEKDSVVDKSKKERSSFLRKSTTKPVQVAPKPKEVVKQEPKKEEPIAKESPEMESKNEEVHAENVS